MVSTFTIKCSINLLWENPEEMEADRWKWMVEFRGNKGILRL